MTKIGVLALQGAIREHVAALKKCGIDTVEVKSVDELQAVDGLILPGGESTAMRRLIDTCDMMKPLKRFISADKPVLGTCAGLILLARTLEDCDESHVGMMDIVARRNSYGRQINSFEAPLEIKDIGSNFPGVFIRAPHIVEIGEGVEVLCRHENRIVMARQDSMLVCAFHPELTDDIRVVMYFVKMVHASIIARNKR